MNKWWRNARKVVFFLLLVVILGFKVFSAEIVPYHYAEPSIRSDDPRWNQALKYWNNRYEDGQVEKALEMFQELASLHPGEVEPELWIGRLYYFLGMRENLKRKREPLLKKSFEQLEKVLARDPENFYALYWLASGFVALSGIDEILPRVEKLAKLIPREREFPVYLDNPKWKAAIEAWDQRDDLDRAWEAVARWKEIAQENPQDFAAFGWLARAHYWLGESAEAKEDKEKIFYEGYEFGLKALKLQPYHYGANFWTGADLARYAQQGSIARKTRLALKIFGHIRISMMEHPAYYHVGVYRYITYCLAHAGSLTQKMLALIGFGPDLVERLYQLARIVAPNYLDTYMASAEYAISRGDYDTARKELEHVLATAPESLPGFIAENRLCHRNAKKLLKEIDKRKRVSN